MRITLIDQTGGAVPSSLSAATTATKYIQDLVSVESVTSNLIYPSNASCGNIDVPSEHKDIGVPNSDLVIYL